MLSNLGTGISSIVLLALPIALQASFQENKGQSHSQIQFVAKFGEAIVRAYPGGLEFAFPESPSLRLAVDGTTQPWIAESQRVESVDYQIGSDPSRWVRDVRTFDRLRMRDVVPGVDWIVYWQGGNIEYDFEVSDFARLDQLTLQATGLPLRQKGDTLTANWKH